MTEGKFQLIFNLTIISIAIFLSILIKEVMGLCGYITACAWFLAYWFEKYNN